MQKLINVLAITSFVISSSIVIVAYNLYENRQELIDYAEDYATEKIQELLNSTSNKADSKSGDIFHGAGKRSMVFPYKDYQDNSLKVDGIWGSRTRSALSDFLDDLAVANIDDATTEFLEDNFEVVKLSDPSIKGLEDGKKAREHGKNY